MIQNRSFYGVLALCVITYLLGMVMIPLMDIDATQYASISREMLVNKSYWQVFDMGHDYLDKPPMLFWLYVISMKIFGVHDWSYRLPSFFFALLAVWSTYRLALLYYQKEVAQISAMVLASAQALFLITHDVRCDTMLMGWVITSIWQLAAWYQNGKKTHFFWAFVCIAGGMMTKGPIALMVPVFAFVPHFVLQRNWQQFFRKEYIVGLILIAILLIPMSIGLYQQFDLHPGKIINGVPIRSGLRFYYWTQSFGRYTGENVFHEMSYFTFLLENMLWSFLPWILFFLMGLVFAVIQLAKKKFKLTEKEEWISTGGFIITYCILARSQAQLPHYIFVVYPLAAIVTGVFLHRLYFTNELTAWKKPLLFFHVFIFTLLWAAAIILMAWPFEQIPKWVTSLACLCFIVFFLIMGAKKRRLPLLLELAFFTVIGVNIFLSTAFYPNVLKFQMGNDAAQFINERKLPKSTICLYGVSTGGALYFYGQYLFPTKTSIDSIGKNNIVLTQKDSLPALQKAFPALKVMHEGGRFGVSMLTLPFLNPDTREKEVPKYLIVDLSGNR